MKKIFFILTMFAATLVFPHGIEIDVVKKSPCVVVECRYTGGMELSYANVKIFFEREKTEFQTGQTDQRGRFCFFPDRQGTWRFGVDDEMGHLEEMKIPIDPSFFANRKSEVPRQKSPTILKALIGVNIILILTLLLYWWKRRAAGAGDKAQ